MKNRNEYKNEYAKKHYDRINLQFPKGEKETLSELRAKNRDYEAQFWGTAKYDFAEWYKNKL